MTAPLDLDALKAKALAATPGEWHSTAQTSGSSFVYVYEATQKSLGAVTSVQNMPKFIASEMSAADAAHAAAANPAVMLELLARLETAEAEAAHYRGVANDVRRQQLGTAPIVDPTKGRYNCAGDYVMPKPFYDPSLHVPAEILAAANMVSTWAAKQDRGSWRIGDVCSVEYGNHEELARLRSNVAILSAQSEALHLVGHAIGVPAGDDVTKAVLPAVKRLVAAAKHEHSCHRDGDITFSMSMRVGNQLFRAGSDLNGLLLGGSIDELPVIAVTAQGLYRQLKSEVADLTRLMACAPNLTPERARAIVSARDKHPADGSTKGGAQ